MRLPAMRRRYERTATAAFGGTHKIAPRTCRPRPTRRLTARSGMGDSLGRPRCDVGAGVLTDWQGTFGSGRATVRLRFGRAPSTGALWCRPGERSTYELARARLTWPSTSSSDVPASAVAVRRWHDGAHPLSGPPSAREASAARAWAWAASRASAVTAAALATV